MTNSSDRLDRLEAIVESNSRAIQALLDARVEDKLELQAVTTRMDAAIARIDEAIGRLTTLNEGVVNLLSSLDSDRPTILRRLNSIENKVDRLLERRGNNGNEPQQ